MGMVATEVKQFHLSEDCRLSDLEREYRAAGHDAAAHHVHAARVLLQKALRFASPPFAMTLAMFEAN